MLPGDQVLAFVVLGLAIIVVVARLVGGLFVRFGQPRVVGEIVGGILLGPSLLGPAVFTWGSPWKVTACLSALEPTKGIPSISSCLFPPQARSVIGVIGQIALIFFMFLVGIEADWSLIKGKLRGVVSVGIGVVILPVLAAFAIAPALYDSKFVAGFGTDAQPSRTAFALMIGAMLSVTAFPVAVRILQEKGLVSTTMGAVGITAAALVTVLMFLVVGVARGVATHQTAGSQVLRLIGTLVYFAVTVLLVRPLLAKFLGPRIERRGSLDGSMFAALIVIVLVSAYTADRIGINVIVGAFVAGSILPAREILQRELSSRLSDLTIVILLPIFLAFSGLQTDFTKLGWAWLPGIALFLVVGVASKWLGGLLFGRLGGLTSAESNVLGVLMNCRGLLVLVVALIGLQNNVISPQLQVGGVLMALVTTAMTGPLIDRFLVAPTPVAVVAAP